MSTYNMTIFYLKLAKILLFLLTKKVILDSITNMRKKVLKLQI